MILSGRELQWYIETGKLKIDPVQPEQFQQNGIDLILENAKYVEPNFYLGCTREMLSLPDDLMAFVGIRSSWARLGFSMPLTIVDAGFQGNLTLEILGFGKTALAEAVDKRFVHLIFAKLTSPSVPYNGKYQHQTGITGARTDK
jgi:dCTP deaminase